MKIQAGQAQAVIKDIMPRRDLRLARGLCD